MPYFSDPQLPYYSPQREGTANTLRALSWGGTLVALFGVTYSPFMLGLFAGSVPATMAVQKYDQEDDDHGRFQGMYGEPRVLRPREPSWDTTLIVTAFSVLGMVTSVTTLSGPSLATRRLK